MTTIIEVNNLEFTYPGATKPAVSGITFDITKGEIFGFLGPSGAGKSTTQKILIGLLKDYKGTASFKGTEIGDLNQEYYEDIGISFELPNHFTKLTALENLSYFASLYEKTNSKDDLLALLDLVGLKDSADTIVGTFSKGMKNRLNVARSLIHDPDMLFLDEPTAGLDPVNAKKIMDIIASKRDEGKTIFLCTHDMVVADTLCDRVAFIVDGTISIIEPPKALKLKYGKKSVLVEYGNGTLQSKEFEMANLAENMEFLDLLRQDDIQTIHSQEASLATVFIEVTGRELQ
ncbi:MAG: ABC transporter ATP-binding protein [Candidatus Heimdallarchaeota archaeon]|nr:ABC transporter ATP-binding protein [Candidatus Heimdallarchaeota archaeon]